MVDRILDRELEAEFAAVAEEAGCELVHAEFHGGTLRVILDRAGGVTLADCEQVSKQLSSLLDVLDFGPGRYTLEVSSPGLDRQLYRDEDYERFRGRRVRVTFFSGEPPVKRTVVGRLAEFLPDGGGRISLAEVDGEEPLTIPLAAIKVARLEIEL